MVDYLIHSKDTVKSYIEDHVARLLPDILTSETKERIINAAIESLVQHGIGFLFTDNSVIIISDKNHVEYNKSKELLELETQLHDEDTFSFHSYEIISDNPIRRYEALRKLIDSSEMIDIKFMPLIEQQESIDFQKDQD